MKLTKPLTKSKEMNEHLQNLKIFIQFMSKSCFGHEKCVQLTKISSRTRKVSPRQIQEKKRSGSSRIEPDRSRIEVVDLTDRAGSKSDRSPGLYIFSGFYIFVIPDEID